MKKKEIHDIDKLFSLAARKQNKAYCSTNKMKEFLKNKGANKNEIKIVINKLERYSLLNEDELVQSILETCDKKHYGYKKIISMLKERQIDPKPIRKIKRNESRELLQCKLMLETLNKRYKNVNTLNLKRKVYSALIRYGFDENLASEASSSLHKSHQEELNVLKLDYSRRIPSIKRKVKPHELENKMTKLLLARGYHIDDIRKVLEENNIWNG